jgi:hypothetical protein
MSIVRQGRVGALYAHTGLWRVALVCDPAVCGRNAPAVIVHTACEKVNGAGDGSLPKFKRERSGTLRRLRLR